MKKKPLVILAAALFLGVFALPSDTANAAVQAVYGICPGDTGNCKVDCPGCNRVYGPASAGHSGEGQLTRGTCACGHIFG